MSRLTRREVERIADLARLSLSDAEAERMTAELETILAYVEDLRSVDTAGVEPTAHAIPLPTPVRDDVARPGLDPERALAGAPEAAAGAFVVPAVIEGDEG